MALTMVTRPRAQVSRGGATVCGRVLPVAPMTGDGGRITGQDLVGHEYSVTVRLDADSLSSRTWPRLGVLPWQSDLTMIDPQVAPTAERVLG